MLRGLKRTRESQLIKSFLGLARHVHANHRDQITGVTVAVAVDDDTGAVDLLAVDRRLQIDRHFRPGRDRFVGSKFDAVFAEANGAGRKR